MAASTRLVINAYRRRTMARLRIEAISALGGRCRRCGFADHRALQFDHVNGGGQAARKRTSPFQMLRRIWRAAIEGTPEYQLLCANCNWIKRAERGETGGRSCMNATEGVA